MTDLPSSLCDRRIFVTGGAGFIGSHLTEALVDDNEVVLDNLSTGVRENVPTAEELVVGDIRDEETVNDLVAEADIVFYQAAMVQRGGINRVSN